MYVNDKVYRYYDSGSTIHLDIAYIIKITPCGYWVGTYPNHGTYEDERTLKVFVNNKWKKKKYHLTKEAAYESYVHRKIRQVEIYTHRLELAKHCLRTANKSKQKLIGMDKYGYVTMYPCTILEDCDG